MSGVSARALAIWTRNSGRAWGTSRELMAAEKSKLEERTVYVGRAHIWKGSRGRMWRAIRRRACGGNDAHRLRPIGSLAAIARTADNQIRRLNCTLRSWQHVYCFKRVRSSPKLKLKLKHLRCPAVIPPSPSLELRLWRKTIFRCPWPHKRNMRRPRCPSTVQQQFGSPACRP